MVTENVITIDNLTKSFKGFKLEIPHLEIPKGFATALIGENGAGKTTLFNILSGIRLDYKGQITCMGEQIVNGAENVKIKEKIGYTGPGNYYLPHWTIKQVEELTGLLFDDFQKERFRQLCMELAIFPDGQFAGKKKVKELSDGTKMKLMLAGMLARDTDLLIMDEPASPLDPVMREKLCDTIRDYIDSGAGEKSVFFSTHNVSDMEYVTDYAIIMEHGQVVEAGFVEDLKEKYILVKGNKEVEKAARPYLYSVSSNSFGFEGICLAENMNALAGMNLSTERPSLFQISVAVMKANSKILMNKR